MNINNSSIFTYRSEIDGLRAFAVISVVFFHVFPSWLNGGFVGVDIFFVISGFLITTHLFQNLDKGQFSFTDFFGRRIRRIFPSLIIVMACSLAFGYLALFDDEFAQLGKHVASGATFITNFILVDEIGYFDNDSKTKPMLHLWSLAVEEQFYIIWPFILWLAWKIKFNLLLFTIFVAVLSFYLNLSLVEAYPIKIFFWPIGRFWEILSGGILAWIMLYKSEIVSQFKIWIDKLLVRIINFKEVEVDGSITSNLMSSLGLLLLLYSVIYINVSIPFPSKWALIPVLGSLLVIASGSKAWLNRLFFMNPIAVWFGLISYPLYLWHWPILSFLQIDYGETMPHKEAKLLAVLLSILLAWLTYKFVESPIRFGKFLKEKTIGLVIVISVFGSIGLVINLYDGIPNRFDNPFEKIQLGRNDKCLGKDKNGERYLVCRIGNKFSTKNILVYGDSHIMHLTSELEKQLGSEYQITAISSGSCFMGTKIKRWHSNKIRANQCKKAHALLEKEISGKYFDITITSQRWHGYGYKTVDDFNRVISDRVKNFGISTKQLFIIGSTNDVNLSCERKKFRPISFSNFCVLERSKLTFNYVNNFVEASQPFVDQATFIYPHQILCGSKRCKALWNGNVIYSNIHHLSKIGSGFVVSQIVSKIKH